MSMLETVLGFFWPKISHFISSHCFLSWLYLTYFTLSFKAFSSLKIYLNHFHIIDVVCPVVSLTSSSLVWG